MHNDGLQNEIDIVNVLDGKMVKELPLFWQKRMKQLDWTILDDAKIEAYKCYHDQKSDISIRVGIKKWNISIKSGHYVSVHMERISTFTGFLRSLGISEELITTLKLFHYGDGTIDGTGVDRKPSSFLKEEMSERIKEFNEAVNKRNILSKIILRFICCGTPIQRSYVTHIYWGTKDYGEMINVKTLIDYYCNAYYLDSTSIHFGPFIYNPAYRGLKNFDSSKVSRYYINIKWPSINRDIKDAKDWFFRNRDKNK